MRKWLCRGALSTAGTGLSRSCASSIARLLLRLRPATRRGGNAGDQFDELLVVFAKLGAFRASQAEGVSAPLMLTMGQPLQFLLAKPDPATVIHTRAEQWENWIKTELCSPSWLVKDESTQALFRHWCASNVSIAEVTSALELAALANDLSPVGIHEQIKNARVSRLVQARTRA